jgi:hypothetical protein
MVAAETAWTAAGVGDAGWLDAGLGSLPLLFALVTAIAAGGWRRGCKSKLHPQLWGKLPLALVCLQWDGVSYLAHYRVEEQSPVDVAKLNWRPNIYRALADVRR